MTMAGMFTAAWFLHALWPTGMPVGELRACSLSLCYALDLHRLWQHAASILLPLPPVLPGIRNMVWCNVRTALRSEGQLAAQRWLREWVARSTFCTCRSQSLEAPSRWTTCTCSARAGHPVLLHYAPIAVVIVVDLRRAGITDLRLPGSDWLLEGLRLH